MHEVPVHVNATMEEEVGQAVSFFKPQRRATACHESKFCADLFQNIQILYLLADMSH